MMTVTTNSTIASHIIGEPVTTEVWNTTGLHIHRKTLMHMTLFWGHKTDVLFPGWPGSSTSMYVMAILFVFVLAVVVEWLNYCNIIKPGANRIAAGVFKTAIHAVRSGMAYMVMLAVMSFNGGIFLAAVFGHAVGYLLVGTRVVFNNSGGSDSGPRKSSDLPLPKC